MFEIVDIIIPVYNSNDTLENLLGSIVMQTYKDINVIIVDDCSQNPADIVIEKFKNLLNIKYVWLEKNHGSGMARNYGLQNSDSKYIVFADSDDTFLNAFAIEKMVYDIESDNYDFASYGFVNQHENYQFSTMPCNATWVFGKIFKREFLNQYNICFPDERFSEDVTFNQICYSLTENIFTSQETYYLHHINEKSVTKTDAYKNDDMPAFTRSYIEAFEFVNSKINISENQKVQWRFVEGLFALYFLYAKSILCNNTVLCEKFFQLIVVYYKQIVGFAKPLLCSEDFTEHYFKIEKEHRFFRNQMVCSLDWFTFINKVDCAA